MNNEAYAWDYLYSRIGNYYGVAGLMGNLMAESGINPQNLQNVGNQKLGMTDKEYTDNVDSGKYSKTKFCYDKFAYGIAQWTYRTRKQGLYEAAKKAGKSIGDLDLQLGYLWDELQLYPEVLEKLKKAQNVKEASDIVLTKYEKPANQSDAVKEKRAKFGNDILTKYLLPEFDKPVQYVRINAKSVNIRTGPSTKFKTLAYAYKNDLLLFVDSSKETGWYKVLFEDGDPYHMEEGWVTNKYTNIVEDS